MTGVVIALDGPSGSGKSTVGRHLARVHRLGCLDTGAQFRAVAWYCDAHGIDLADGDGVAVAARDLPLEQSLDPDDQRVVVGGVDVTDAIREPRISTVVSQVATNLEVRAELRRRQRSTIAAEVAGGWSDGRGILVEGRDITTVIAPDADVRMLLVARAEERLARRALEVHGSVDADAIEATRDQILRRDADDATVSTFHEAADGVVTLDSSTLTLEETLAAAERIVTDVLSRS
ncbi:MAG TPA: (d)CMP kinase [Micrococcales bacterium]|uniref:Cytidylate kinase n=1 Tax=Miniimonas arenae TaxID=676201 RepID=A0A5C5BHC7_9MICO|nr:(d)CMP kinase [Miniimonas arenae]TNU76983.1 (d)CMP kinase [Miniimonas arenae]HCX84719.1 (d)CMP kinase [Micrococcales bacterium]